MRVIDVHRIFLYLNHERKLVSSAEYMGKSIFGYKY